MAEAQSFTDSAGVTLSRAETFELAAENASGSLSFEELLTHFVDHLSEAELHEWADAEEDDDRSEDELRDAAATNARGSHSKVELLDYYLAEQSDEELLQWATDANGEFPD